MGRGEKNIKNGNQANIPEGSASDDEWDGHGTGRDSASAVHGQLHRVGRICCVTPKSSIRIIRILHSARCGDCFLRNHRYDTG